MSCRVSPSALSGLPRAIVDNKWSGDICVYGATPSGVLAAYAAAREGMSVIIVEPSRWVGGILGCGIQPSEDNSNPSIVGGLARAVFKKAGVSPESITAYFEHLVSVQNIPVIYENRLASVEKAGARIVGITLEYATRRNMSSWAGMSNTRT